MADNSSSVAPDSPSGPSGSERWETEVRLRERELDAKLAEHKRWWVAIVVATVTAFGAGWVASINGSDQRRIERIRTIAQIELERSRVQGQQIIEEVKAEAARILEMIKTGDPDKAAENLDFLLKAGLIINKTRRADIERYLKERQPGKGPRLPPVTATMNAVEAPDTATGSGCVCPK